MSVLSPNAMAHPGRADGVSRRSMALMKGPLSYIGALFRAQKDLWHKETNPDGWIPLVVAENKLSNQEVLDRIAAVQDFPTSTMNYANMKGVPQLQLALAGLMQHTFLRGHTIDPSLVCIQSGCSAVLDHLFYCIADEGEGVLIPAPYYPAFDNDLQAKNHVRPLPFYLDETCASASVAEQLDAAVAAAAGAGIAVRGLLITNPDNPTGKIYSDATISAMLRWCLDHQVHYISDEIYALSVYKPAPFTSAITLAQRLVEGIAASSNGHLGVTQAAVDTYVHLVYGLSKDWCGSGLRVGLLYSRNTVLQQALNSITTFGCVSNHSQHAIAEALSDLAWADSFLQKNQRKLEVSYDTLASALSTAGIPFQPAVAGMFVWLDLSAWLPEPTWEGERRLWESICDTSHVVLTPGHDCHAEMPGCFRLCFAWVEPEALAVAVQRVAKQLGPAPRC